MNGKEVTIEAFYKRVEKGAAIVTEMRERINDIFREYAVKIAETVPDQFFNPDETVEKEMLDIYEHGFFMPQVDLTAAEAEDQGWKLNAPKDFSDISIFYSKFIYPGVKAVITVEKPLELPEGSEV